MQGAVDDVGNVSTVQIVKEIRGGSVKLFHKGYFLDGRGSGCMCVCSVQFSSVYSFTQRAHQMRSNLPLCIQQSFAGDRGSGSGGVCSTSFMLTNAQNK